MTSAPGEDARSRSASEDWFQRTPFGDDQTAGLPRASPTANSPGDPAESLSIDEPDETPLRGSCRNGSPGCGDTHTAARSSGARPTLPTTTASPWKSATAFAFPATVAPVSVVE